MIQRTFTHLEMSNFLPESFTLMSVLESQVTARLLHTANTFSGNSNNRPL